MYDYYIGNTDVKKEYPKTDRSNRIVTDNFVKSFSDEEVSFMVGLPITYVDLFNNDNSTIEDINIKMNINSNANIDLCTNLLIFGGSYELYYKYNDEFKIKSLNSYAYINSEKEVELFMYYYKKPLDDNTYVYNFNESFIPIDDPKPHFMRGCPVGVAALPN